MLSEPAPLEVEAETPAEARPPVALDPFATPIEELRVLGRAGYTEAAAAGVLRALVAHPDHPQAPTVRLQLSRFQRQHGQLDAEEITLADGVSLDPSSSSALWLRLVLADARLQRGDLQGVHQAVSGLPELPSEGAVLLGWALFLEGDESGAVEQLARVEGPLAPLASGLSSDVLSTADLPHRRPLLAAGLSVVPGLGHVYAGKPGVGAAQLLIQGGLLAGAGVLAVDGRYAPAGALAGLWLTSWVSGMADARRQADRFNEHHERERVSTLQAAWWVESSLTGRDDAPVALVPSNSLP